MNVIHVSGWEGENNFEEIIITAAKNNDVVQSHFKTEQ